MPTAPVYSHDITDFWRAPLAAGNFMISVPSFAVAISTDLRDDGHVTITETADGLTIAALTPGLARVIGLNPACDMAEEEFRRRLLIAGIVLHSADNLFYFTESEKRAVIAEGDDEGVRRLNEDDRDAFAEFEAAASSQDRDDAYVELDHWAVFGAFDNGRLASAASAYPWNDSLLADIGVLTRPRFRQMGHGRRVVRAISRFAYANGYQPQYRSQLDNVASAALARVAGLTRFGTWETVSPDQHDEGVGHVDGTE